MFSDAGFWQELLALAVAVSAGIYLVGRLTGWPQRLIAKNAGAPRPDRNVVPSRRLGRALAKARRQR